MVDGEESKVAPAGTTTSNGHGGEESRKDTCRGKKGSKESLREKKVNFHDDVGDAHKPKNPRNESGGGGKAATTMMYVKKSNESPMEINTVDKAEGTSTAFAAASSNTTNTTTAAATTEKTQKQSNGQPRDMTVPTNAAHNYNNSSLRGRNTINGTQRHHGDGI